MNDFSQLITQLDETTKTNSRLELLISYFEKASDEDKVWTIALLSGKKPKRSIQTAQLKRWAADISHTPDWLFEETYHIVGDLAETISLLIDHNKNQNNLSLANWMEGLEALKTKTELDKQRFVFEAWKVLDRANRFTFNKLITGGFRIGVSQKLMTKALAKHTGIEENILAHKLMGNWSPTTQDYNTLLFSRNSEAEISRPYPFFLAYALEQNFDELGLAANWQFEYKWDGIRGQLIKRKGAVFIWSRGEELVTDKYPELVNMANFLPDGAVLDGEIVAWKDNKPMNFHNLQTRIGKKNISKQLMEKTPVAFIVYDVLEFNGKDIRMDPLLKRRKKLEELLNINTKNGMMLSEDLNCTSWEEAIKYRLLSRENGSEGLMIKRKDSPYLVGRKKGLWLKWKVDPLTIDGVLIYAMRGHGRRSNLYTDFTFAVWDGDNLVPFTKAYSGLTDAEFKEVDKFIKANTIERFGPVKSVEPKLVFELAFEGIAASKRHKSGIALRFPRIKRWRKDKNVNEANTLDDLKNLLSVYP